MDDTGEIIAIYFLVCRQFVDTVAMWGRRMIMYSDLFTLRSTVRCTVIQQVGATRLQEPFDEQRKTN